MKKANRPALSTLTADQIDEFKDSDGAVAIGFFDGPDTSEHKKLMNLAEELRDSIQFGATTDAALAEKFGVKTPGLVVLRTFEDGKDVFDGDWDDEALKSFVKDNSVTLIGELSAKNADSFEKQGLPLAYIFVENNDQRRSIGREVKTVARDLKDDIIFTFIDANQYGYHASVLNLNETWPAMAIVDTKENVKYTFPQNEKISEAAVRDLAEAIVAGTATPSIKSQPVPESNDGPVTVVVADTFDKIVKDAEKDVLIELYAPWCGFCQKLEPIYVDLAKLYEDAADIVIAKMDATANDIPPSAGYALSGFPTLLLYKAKDNTLVEYNGDRSLLSFIEFISENAVSSFTPKTPEAIDKEDADEAEEAGHHDEL